MFLQENVSDSVFSELVLLVNLCLEILFSLSLSLSPQSSFFLTLHYEEFQPHRKVESILVNTHHLDYTINILLHWLYHVYLPKHSSMHSSYFLIYFNINCRRKSISSFLSLLFLFPVKFWSLFIEEVFSPSMNNF